MEDSLGKLLLLGVITLLRLLWEVVMDEEEAIASYGADVVKFIFPLAHHARHIDYEHFKSL